MRKQLFTLCMMVVVAFTSLQSQTVRSFESSNEQIRMTLHTPDLQVQSQVIASDTFNVISLDGFTYSTQVGAPQLPVMRQMVEIPLCESVEVEILSSNSRSLSAQSLSMRYPLMPLQPARRKSDKSPEVLHLDAAVYSQNQMFSCEMLSVNIMGVARDRNLAMVEFSPLSYNPVTGEMQLVTDVQLVLKCKNADLAATRKMKSLHHSGMFATAGVLNDLPLSKDVRTAAPVRYLIVSHSSFRGQLDEFVAWKRQLGYLTDIVYTDDPAVGTTNTAIAAYLKSQYTNATEENPAPTYVLLVGDHQQIPAFSGRASEVDNDHVTDLYFYTWTTGDIVPDCYYGRFSAQNVAQLTPQISKTLLYEQYKFTDPSYLSKAILVAGVDAGYSSDNAYRYGDPAMDYVAKTYVNSANGFSTVYYYKNNTSYAPSGVTVSGSSQSSTTAAVLRNLYNEGAGWVNYSAHGYDDEWSTPNFTTTHVSRMTNNGKPMIMIGNCCLSNKFNTTYASECLGEALLRKDNDAGAVAYIGGTNSTYWNYDFYWSVGVRSSISNTMNASYSANNLGMYDRLFHTHGESFDKWYNTMGSMIMAGNMAVAASGSSSYSKYYWEIYELMGDPSLKPWLGIPGQINLNVPDFIAISDVDVEVDAVPYAYVALLSDENELISAAFADASGRATLSWDYLSLGSYKVVASAQNYKVATAPVEVVSPSNIRLLARHLEASNPVAGDTTTFSFMLYNKGENDFDSISIRLRGNPTQLTSIDGNYIVTNLAAGDSIQLSGVATSVISPSVANQQRVQATMSLLTTGGIVDLPVRFVVSAPKLAAELVSVTGNLVPGGAATLSVRISNNGAATASNLSARMTHLYGLAQVIDTATLHFASLQPDESELVNFNVRLGANVPDIPVLRFDLMLADNGGEQAIAIDVPYKADLYDNFESGDFSTLSWNNDNTYPWIITSTGAHQGQFSARSFNFTSAQDYVESELVITASSPLPGTVRFYYNVSSEENYDKFHFSIDGTEVLSASGTSNNWTLFTYDVEAGSHTYMFSYTKDVSRSYGSDCAWIDEVTIPATSSQCFYEKDTVCVGVPYTHCGESVNTNQVGTVTHSATQNDGMHYLSLDVLPAPEVTILASDDVVIEGDVAYLVAVGADTYRWNMGDTTDVVIVRPDHDTVFVVEGFRGGCSATAQLEMSVLEGHFIGVQEVRTDAVLYPNPTQDRLNVAVPELKSITVFDAVGRMLQRHHVAGSTAFISLKSLTPGIYFVMIETAAGSSMHKIVKQ